MNKKTRHLTVKTDYTNLLAEIGKVLITGRSFAITTVNQVLLKTYWHIGKQIIEYEQKGKEKAEYGSTLLGRLSEDLRLRYGKGFSKSNVYLMRILYLKHPIFQTVSGKLSWSHYSELLSVKDNAIRKFYETQCSKEMWSVCES